MDFSFEKAFDKKEKDFMLAYRVRNWFLIDDLATHHINLRRNRRP